MEIITSGFSFVTSNLTVILEVVGAFSLLATMTPNKSDDEVMAWVLKAVNFLGANTGKAKNLD
jgi:hypothetical protein|tara:strand:+ start:742 stop:930 length:189 start_codon:yes stop_codon:yes gene_type:complete